MASEQHLARSDRSARRARFLGAALGVAVGISVGTSHAEPGRGEPTAAEKETARALMDTGRTKESARDLEGALEAYLAADRIMAVPSTGLSAGRAYAALGKLVEARDVLLRVARFPVVQNEPRPYALARQEARRLEAAIAPRIPALTVVVGNEPLPDGLLVTIDGVSVPNEALAFPIKVNPGRRVVVASAKGYRQAEHSVELRERQAVDLNLRLELDPDAIQQPEPSLETGAVASEQADASGISPVAWAGLGIGGACLVVGVVTGALAVSKSSELEQACPEKRCPPDRAADIDTMRALSHSSTVMLVLAGVGVTVGIVSLFALSDDDGPHDGDAAAVDTETAIRLLVGPGTLQIAGRF